MRRGCSTEKLNHGYRLLRRGPHRPRYRAAPNSRHVARDLSGEDQGVGRVSETEFDPARLCRQRRRRGERMFQIHARKPGFVLFDLSDEIWSCRIFGHSDFVQGVPKCVLQVDASASPKNPDAPLYDGTALDHAASDELP